MDNILKGPTDGEHEKGHDGEQCREFIAIPEQHTERGQVGHERAN
jgi:hypothetical protein